MHDSTYHRSIARRHVRVALLLGLVLAMVGASPAGSDTGLPFLSTIEIAGLKSELLEDPARQSMITFWLTPVVSSATSFSDRPRPPTSASRRVRIGVSEYFRSVTALRDAPGRKKRGGVVVAL